jgi:mannose-6-phosphate isomerase-like protein (cupin superfamily)/uncharacterized protein YndB with AHSA1/START domain
MIRRVVLHRKEEAMMEKIELPDLGARIELIRDTPDEVVFDVIGRPRGFVAQEHIHAHQVEGYEVLSGAMRVMVGKQPHILRPGDTMEVPAGVPHRQLPEGTEPGHVRVTVRPARRTAEFLRRLAAMPYNRFGFPRLVAGAELVRDFADEGSGTRPPVAVQHAFSRVVLDGRRALRHLWREYVFVDEWDVRAPIEPVFRALSDARTYPEWWRPVYIDVEADGEPAVGKTSRQHFKGRLPYHLHTTSRTTRLEPPRVVEGEVTGDLSGRGVWTLTPGTEGTHVRFDWRVYADRPLLRALTPLLRPLLRWNHAWAIARATEGLEPYARRAAGGGT